MDLTVLSRKISSYRTPKGRITKLPNELLGEILLYKRSRRFQPSFLKKSKKSNNQRAGGFIFLYVKNWIDTKF